MLALAHVGDAVYELLVRTYFCGAGTATSQKMHQRTVSMVSAHAQAAAVKKILPLLTEAESAVFMRGRNAQTPMAPRTVPLAEYHAATGLEALFGHLYLTGDLGRIETLFAAILEA